MTRTPADTLTYSLSGTGSEKFAVSSSGAVTYTGAGEDYEAVTAYTLTVTARDTAGATGTAAVTVNITNVNEAPTFGQSTYTFTLAENQAGTPTAIALGHVSASDPDAGDTLTYRLSGTGSEKFAVSSSGAVTYIGSGEDYETTQAYTLAVTARDTAGATGTASVVVQIKNTAPGNTAPTFDQSQYTFTLAENQAGTPTAVALGSVSASDPDAGDTLTYRLSGAGSDQYETVSAC